MLERQVGEYHARAEQEIINAMGEPFAERLAFDLAEIRLENDGESRQIVGARIKNKVVLKSTAI